MHLIQLFQEILIEKIFKHLKERLFKEKIFKHLKKRDTFDI